MIINCSNYLEEKIDELQLLIELLLDYFDDASILATDAIGKRLTASRYETNIYDNYLSERGFVARLVKKGVFFEYSFNAWEDIDILKSCIVNKFKEHNDCIERLGLSYFDQAEMNMNKEFIYETDVREVKIGISEVTTEDLMKRLKALHEYGMSLSDQLVDLRCHFNYLIVSKVFVSSTKTLKQAYMTCNMVGVVFAKDEQDKMVRFYDSVGGLKGLEIIDDFEFKIPELIRATLELFNADRIQPGMYDIICEPLVSGLIAHEAFGHGVETDMFVKNRALAKDYMDRKVASDLVTIKDGATAMDHVGSYLFDDEGTIGKETVIIEKGILKAGISDYSSAKRLDIKATGNGRRESFERKAYTRMTNTYFEKGSNTLEEMISSIQYGYLLEGAMNGMEDPKHWGIQCMVAKGREIVEGEFTGKIVSPIILTGYVPTLLQNVSMVGNEVFLGAGSCGKGYKEFIQVSFGGPYIKTKARLG